MAVCGNLDVAGGNIQANEPPQQRLGEFVRAETLPAKPKEMIHAQKGCIPRLMTVPPVYFRRAVLDEDPYPVRGAYVQCANPVMAYADSNLTVQALQKLDFLAVSDIFMTPTAAMADIVLPAATHLEFDDIGHYGLGHGILLARPRAVSPPGECRPDLEIINALGKLLSSPSDWFEDYHEMLDGLLAPAGLNFDSFAKKGYLRGEDKFQKYETSGFKTPTGKVELCLSKSEKLGLPALPEFKGPPEPEDRDFPLVLTSCKDPLFLHSSYRWLEALRQRRPQPQALLHPETAAPCGITDGEKLIIETRSGRIAQTAHLTDTIPPGTVFAAYGWWFPEMSETDPRRWQSANFNCLTTVEGAGKQFGTPNLKGINCRIRKAKPS
jgi:anaerobic selenocysteine-containing dehydrogenase